MRTLTICITAMFSVCSIFTSCAKTKNADGKNKSMGTKTLVAYFSATGTTEGVAKKIASVTGGELFEIAPVQKYSSADLDWTDHSSRSCKENANPKSRPDFVKSKKSLNEYDVIYLGYPIWWDQAPRIVNSFIEYYKLDGKKVIPFATSGGSGVSNSVSALKKTYPKVNWQQGKLLNHPSVSDIKTWTGN